MLFHNELLQSNLSHVLHTEGSPTNCGGPCELASRRAQHILVTLPRQGPAIHYMRPQEPEDEMEEIEARIAQGRQALLAGPASSDQQRRNVKLLISERLPRAVEHLQRQPMSTSVAKRAARFFAMVQDFVDTCLRSPLLGEGLGPLLRLDLSPLLYVLRLLVAAEPVPPRYLTDMGRGVAAGGSVPPHYFNRDHGKPLLREFRGHWRQIWPGDEAAR